MTYLVVLTFDLAQNSQNLYEVLNTKLADIGLKKELRGNSGKEVQLPSNTYSGKFTGTNVTQLRDDITELIKKIFSDNDAHGKIFLTVGGNSWAWTVLNL